MIKKVLTDFNKGSFEGFENIVSLDMESSRVIIVSFIDQLKEDFSFTKWPNHITVVPYFQTKNQESLIVEITDVCKRFNNVPYKVGELDFFGSEKNVEVSKVVPNEIISRLHETLLKVALKNDPDMELKYCEENYKPHITHNFQPFPKESDTGILKTVYLVENISSESERKDLQVKRVLAVFDLLG